MSLIMPLNCFYCSKSVNSETDSYFITETSEIGVNLFICFDCFYRNAGSQLIDIAETTPSLEFGLCITCRVYIQVFPPAGYKNWHQGYNFRIRKGEEGYVKEFYYKFCQDCLKLQIPSYQDLKKAKNAGS